MTDYMALQEAAEYAAQDVIKFADENEEMRALQQFHEEVDPETVLALIAENEQLEIERAELWRGKRDVEAIRDTKSAVIAELKAEIAGLKTGYEAYARVNAELKAENEALRKDAARYEWLRQARSGYIEVVEWIGPHATGMTGDDLDALLDAAMGKGGQS